MLPMIPVSLIARSHDDSLHGTSEPAGVENVAGTDDVGLPGVKWAPRRRPHDRGRTDVKDSVQILATDDPNVTQIDFVEHLDAASGSDGDVIKGMQHNYASIIAAAHGNPIPPCP